MYRWFNAISVDKPFMLNPGKWLNLIRKDIRLSIACLIATILHVYQIAANPDVLMFGDEALRLNGVLWIYTYLDSALHHYFQYVIWILLVLIIWKRRKITAVIADLYQQCQTNRLYRNLCILLVMSVLSGYFILLRDLPHYPGMVRYPPVTRFMYLASYLLTGIDPVGPRILQLVLYVLTAIYLYRIILMFNSRDAALIGASLYLFLPIPYFYAHTAELGSGTVFFITACSYYLLRHIEYGDNRDLLIASFLISLGTLFHNLIFLMFFISAAYLVLIKVMPKGRNIVSGNTFKVVLISLVPIIPWMIIRRLFTWRNYDIIWPHLWSSERYGAFLSLMNTNLSLILFSLFLISVVFIMKDRNREILIFFGLLFVGYFLFLVADWVPQSARLSMTFYPTIAVYLSFLFSKAIHKIDWKHASKIIYIVLMLYLMTISILPSLNKNFYLEEKSKVEQYPSEKAMKWIDDNVKEGEKILTLRMLPVEFYRVKFNISNEKIIDRVYDLADLSTPDKLKSFCNRHGISYIMFPYSMKPPKVILKEVIVPEIVSYLINNADNAYEEIKRFNMDANYIHIYKFVS
jgi:hypothetical protein